MKRMSTQKVSVLCRIKSLYHGDAIMHMEIKVCWVAVVSSVAVG